jgi:hypothetical protein
MPRRAALFVRRWGKDPVYWTRSAIPLDLLTSTLRSLGGAAPVGRAVMGLPPRGFGYPYAAMSRPSYLVIGLPLQIPPGGQAFALPPVYFNGFWG